MSTDPYPEVSVDESGIVPPQGGRGAEWPKKIRTLTAAELDRLTIDSAGRFYWDGRLVNYEPPEDRETGSKSDETVDHSAMEIIERASYELDAHKVPEPIEGADLPQHMGTHVQRRSVSAVDFDVASHDEEPAPATEMRPAQPMAQMAPMAPPIHTTERVRLKMSLWQSLGAIILVLGIMVGASGVAAYGWVVAHDWSCRIGLVKSYCPAAPPTPALRQRPRTDIPA
jgi:hypothetical protein